MYNYKTYVIHIYNKYIYIQCIKACFSIERYIYGLSGIWNAYGKVTCPFDIFVYKLLHQDLNFSSHFIRQPVYAVSRILREKNTSLIRTKFLKS